MKYIYIGQRSRAEKHLCVQVDSTYNNYKVFNYNIFLSTAVYEEKDIALAEEIILQLVDGFNLIEAMKRKQELESIIIDRKDKK